MDKKEALKQIKARHFSLADADKKLKADKEIVLAAVKLDGSALGDADASLKKDKEFVLAAVQENGDALYYADASLKKDKEVVLAAIKQDGNLLEYVDKKIRSDKAFMKKHITEGEIFEKYFISKENLKKNIYSVHIEGSGYEVRGTEISQKIYEYFKDDDEKLREHVSMYNDESVPKDVYIGIYDECADMEVIGAELNNSSLEIECDGELQTIELSEDNIKKIGINSKIQNVNLEDFIKEKKGFFFYSYEYFGGRNQDTTKIIGEKVFDPKKLSLTITHLKSDFVEVKAITHLQYDDKIIETTINSGDGDLPEFQVIKVTK